MKKLIRSSSDKMLAGVCGGISQYLQIDSTVIRLLVAVATLFSGGIVILFYIIAAFIIPTE